MKNSNEVAELIEELELVNKKLAVAEKYKTNFLSNLRNEMNNPLTSLVCLTQELVEVDREDKETINLTLNMIHSDVRVLVSQIRSMIIAAELEAGEISIRSSKLHLKSIVMECLKDIDSLIKEKDITISVDIDDKHSIHTDKEKLQVALTNIISNGVIFNHPGGFVDIRSEETKDNKIIISIKDNGIGIRKDLIGAIFERFKQLDTGVSKLYGGHGLGLSIVKSITEILDGEIVVNSSLGKGSTFSITLPTNLDSSEDMKEYDDGVEFF